MDTKQLILLALQVAIFGTVFGLGLQARLDDVLYLVRRPGLLLRSLLAMFVVMPVLVVVLVKIFEFRMPVEVVLVVLAISPVPPLLPNKEKKAGGSHRMVSVSCWSWPSLRSPWSRFWWSSWGGYLTGLPR